VKPPRLAEAFGNCRKSKQQLIEERASDETISARWFLERWRRG